MTTHAQNQLNAFWQTHKVKVDEHVAIYDLLTDGDREKQQLLDKLLEFVRDEASAWEAYNSHSN